MAPYSLGFLQPDMLLLWDRSFLSFRNVTRVRQRRAAWQALWRDVNELAKRVANSGAAKK